MSFAINTALKNIRRKPFRALSLLVIVLFLSLTLFCGVFLIVSLQNGLSGYQARLGADILVTPASAQGHGTVDDIYLQGITGNYYIPINSLKKLEAVEGIERMSEQFYLTSAKASCCSARVQIIGFDPETDFSIQPWIGESFEGSLHDGDLVIGAEIALPTDGQIRFYGENYHVAAQLAKTGTGLDNAVFTSRSTIRRMAETASNTLERESLKGVDIQNAASAVLIKVKDGYLIDEVADEINLHVPKVKAMASRSMVTSVAQGFEGASGVIGLLVGGVWLLAIVILIAVFALLSNERKKEFAVLRVVGASRGQLLSIMGTEAAFVSAVGALTGMLLSVILSAPLSSGIRQALSLPFLQPEPGLMALLSVGAVLLPVLACVLTALLSAVRITKNETGLLLREDA